MATKTGFLYRLMHPGSNAPLVTFRVAFGALMLFSILRFWHRGWIETQYLEPVYFFHYEGLDWIRPLSEGNMYIIFTILALSAVGITIGLFYRVSTITFFFLFTWCELIDKTNYLNHYYFVSIIALLLIFSPAHRRFSIDVLLGLTRRESSCHSFYRYLFMLQLSLVYFYAGLAKVNADWLFQAQPLTTWLRDKEHLPLIGSLLSLPFTPWLFSWFGCLYDLTISYFLLKRRTVYYAWIAVVIFHILTWVLFPIGIFPWVMITSTAIFFPLEFHEKVVSALQRFCSFSTVEPEPARIQFAGIDTDEHANTKRKSNIDLPASELESLSIKPSVFFGLLPFLTIFFVLQLLLPLRHLAFPGDVLWYEEGFRFSWRVMLVEKSGEIWFRIHDKTSGREMIAEPSSDLSPQQQKQMSFQPDMILQYAHHLGSKIRREGYDPEIYAESYVSFNGRESQRYVREDIDLLQVSSGMSRTLWMEEPR